MESSSRHRLCPAFLRLIYQAKGSSDSFCVKSTVSAFCGLWNDLARADIYLMMAFACSIEMNTGQQFEEKFISANANSSGWLWARNSQSTQSFPLDVIYKLWAAVILAFFVGNCHVE